MKIFIATIVLTVMTAFSASAQSYTINWYKTIFPR